VAARLALLCVAALALLAAACGSSAAKAKDSSTADAYTAVLKHLMPPPDPNEDKQVVYVAPFANQKAIALETQVDVIDALTALVTVRFVDELSEAVQDDAPGSPAKGSEVVLLGPLVTTGSVTEVEAQRYASETDQVRYRFRVTSTADGGWEATQVEAVDVPPTTSS
jgi:ABC-type Fe3+-hydroxamate transport system substrate-binding protein